MKKRAQTEIIGVVIIVIILILGGLLMLRYKLKQTNTSRQEFTDPKLAQSTLNALMNTKTERNVIVGDIIKDCYSNRNDLCGSTTSSDCCEYAYLTMRNALEATLGEWQRSYRLSVQKGNLKKIDDIYNNELCNEDTPQSQPGYYYIPPPPPIVVRLSICQI